MKHHVKKHQFSHSFQTFFTHFSHEFHTHISHACEILHSEIYVAGNFFFLGKFNFSLGTIF